MIHSHIESGPLHSVPRPLFPLATWVLLFLSAIAAAAQPSNESKTPNAFAAAPTSGATSGRWAFIICGHPGDEAHRKLFADSAVRIRKALSERFGFPADNVWIRFGADGKDKQAIEASRGPAVKESLAVDVAQLRKQVRESDELWVFVIGHAHVAGRAAQLNLPGTDVGPAEFAQWFARIPCRRSVFFMTTPLSGYFIKPLAEPRRVVIAATEADYEVNETLLHSSLAKLLETFPKGGEHDVDKDGVYSLLDLYLAVALDVADLYALNELLATEHAQLDDNGDGRGAELQLQYLPEEDTIARPPARKSAIRPGADGALAKSIDLGSAVRKKSDDPPKQ